MTSYCGGKARQGKKIFHIIRNLEEQWKTFKNIAGSATLPYFEPFLGMGGVAVHFATAVEGSPDEETKRPLYGCDKLEDIIEFWNVVTKENWNPPPQEDCWSRAHWVRLKKSKPSALRCFIGVVASWRCIFFASYRHHFFMGRNYYAQAVRKMNNMRQPMKRFTFLKSRSYDEFM